MHVILIHMNTITFTKFIVIRYVYLCIIVHSYVFVVIAALMDENLQYLSQRQTSSLMEKKQLATICILYWAFLHDDQ